MRYLLSLLITFLLCTAAYGEMYPVPMVYNGGASGNSCSGWYGYNNASPSNQAFYDAGALIAVKIPLGCSGTTASMSAQMRYTNGTNAQFRYAIYSDNGGVPGTKLVESGELSDSISSTPAWAPHDLAATISGDPAYVFLVVQVESSSSGIGYTSGTGSYFWSAGTWGTFPTTFDTSDGENTTKLINIGITF